MMDYLGFDLGGTKCAVVAARADFHNNECELLSRVEIKTERDAWQKTLASLCDAASSLVSKCALAPVACGISSGGPLDAKRGIIQSPPNLPGWDDVPVVEYVASRFKIPAFLQNDANACALAEWRFGAGKGCGNLIFLTFGTGLGAGLIFNNRLYEGVDGFAGEVGHMRLQKTGPIGYGKRGSFEGFCSGGGIAQLGKTFIRGARKRGEKSPLLNLVESDINAKTIANAADDGDELALRVYRKSAQELGAGLLILIDLLNPEKIIIGSVFARSEHLFRAEMERVIAEETLAVPRRRCAIVPAALVNKIGDYACIGVAARGVEII